jgi:hypothetical protein
MDALLHRDGGFIQVLHAGGKVQELHRLMLTSVTPVIENGEPAYMVRYLDNSTVTRIRTQPRP